MDFRPDLARLLFLKFEFWMAMVRCDGNLSSPVGGRCYAAVGTGAAGAYTLR